MSAREDEGYLTALVMNIPELLGLDMYTGGGVKALKAWPDCSIGWSSKARCSAR